MNRKDVEEMQHRLLERLTDQMQEDLIAAVLRESEDADEPEVIEVLFDEMGLDNEEAVGEFFFRPFMTEEDDIQFFSGIITFTEELSEEYLPVLYEAMSYLNFVLPCGSFIIDKEHRFLSFRLSVPLPVDMPEEELYREMNILCGDAVEIADVYMDLLIKLSDGRATIFDVRDVLE